MDTGKLKRFATEARINLIDGVRRKLRSLGFDEEGNLIDREPLLLQGATLWKEEEYPEAFYHQWKALQEKIQKHGVQEVVEEAAYTWFNRLVAIRILTKNKLCEPILMTEGNASGYPLLLEAARMGRVPRMDVQQQHRFDKLMDNDTLVYDQFALLLTLWCHDNPIINACFGSTHDFVELLLPENILRPDGFLTKLNTTDFISDEDFKSAELIGWLYQFYISERKDEVFAKKGKYEADDIPAATQIFTPNWIVKYMVENTILPQVDAPDDILGKAKYLVDNPDAAPSEKIELEDMKVADFACGSGHILNECFDLLFDLYREEAYSRREAVEAIFTKNLFGIDIDLRAKQLATFALLLKACQKDASFADATCLPRVLTVPEMPQLVQDPKGFLPHFFLGSLTKDAKDELCVAWEDLKHADVLGSIIKFRISDSTRRQIKEAVEHWKKEDFIPQGIQDGLPIMDFILALTDGYNAVVMNPPYMPTNKIDVLNRYVNENYKEGKADMFAVFMMVCMDRLCKGGRMGMINMQSWMFLGSFESLRKLFLEKYYLSSMLHLGPHTFDELSGEVVQNTAFIFEKNMPFEDRCGIYYRLTSGKNCLEKNLKFIANENIYIVPQQNFSSIKGFSMAYWASKKILSIFSNEKSLNDICRPRLGQNTGDNNRFLRAWYEISFNCIGFNIPCNYNGFGYKWIKYTKGGISRRWYGPSETIINWENDGAEIKEYCVIRNNGKHWSRYIQNWECSYKEGYVFPRIGSGKFQARYIPSKSIYDVNAPGCFPKANGEVILGYINSNVFKYFLDILCQTLTFQVGDVSKAPFAQPSQEDCDIITKLTKSCIEISKSDWDAHETSWDFQGNPLLQFLKDEELKNPIDVLEDKRDADTEILYPEAVRCDANLVNRIRKISLKQNSLYSHYLAYRKHWTKLFKQLWENEIELNKRFIQIYDLQEELSPNVPYNEVTILQQGEVTPDADDVDGVVLCWHSDVIIKQLISYIVGCYMGRYRLEKPGLAIAHPNPTAEELADYTFNITGEETFTIDSDAIIPVLPTDAPFYDNLYNYVSEFIRKVWGADSHTENMNFIDSCLGKPLNDYLMRDFWKDHKKMYQNRPIYWEFASPKGAFRAIVYAHRMDRFTVEVLRSKYLLPYRNFIEQKIANLEARYTDLTTAERRELDTLRKKTLPELTEYHDRVEQVAAETAARETVFDLDDGIPHNHSLFGSIVTKLK